MSHSNLKSVVVIDIVRESSDFSVSKNIFFNSRNTFEPHIKLNYQRIFRGKPYQNLLH